MASDHRVSYAYMGSNPSAFQYEGIDGPPLGSPGGVPASVDHWTGGMYGQGASKWDVYGPDPPAYPYAEYGNLYTRGQKATIDRGYEDDVTYVDAPPTIESFSEGMSTDAKHHINPMSLFLLIVIAYVAFTYWGRLIDRYISEYTGTKKGSSTTSLVLVAILFTAILFVSAWILGIPPSHTLY